MSVHWIFLLSGSNQKMPELAEAWVVCVQRKEEEGGKSQGKRGKRI